MMLQAQVDGNYNVQSELEQEVTRRVNEANVGPLGLGGENECYCNIYESWTATCKWSKNCMRQTNLLL